MAGRSAFLQADDIGVNLHFDDDADATPALNIDGGPTKLTVVTINNLSLASKVYFHAWDNGNPVMGTTPQDYQIPVAASSKQTVSFGAGVDFEALSYAVTTDKGTTANTSPATPPDAYLNTSTTGGD